MATKVTLASASPRRKQLLESAGLVVHVQASNVDEAWPGGTIEAGVVQLAIRKLEAIGPVSGIVIAADTLVVLGDELLGKPTDATHARSMLTQLSGREHRVVTGFCVASGEKRCHGAVTTHVTFRTLTPAEISLYVASGEPFDKAGAYAIQGMGGALIERVEGSYTNIVGLPLAEVLAAIEAVVS